MQTKAYTNTKQSTDANTSASEKNLGNPVKTSILKQIKARLNQTEPQHYSRFEEQVIKSHYKKLASKILVWRYKLPPELASEYRDWRLLQNFVLIRISIVMGIIFLLGAQLLEAILLREMPTDIWRMRAPVLIILICTWFTCNTLFFHKYHQKILSICLLFVCLGALGGAIVFPTEPYKTLNYVALVLIQLTAFTVTPIRPSNASFIASLLAVCTIFSLFHLEDLPNEHWLPIALIYLAGSAVSVFISYQLDRINLMSFLQSIILRMEKLKLNHANTHLKGLAATDSLTGISNRREFDNVLKQEWNRATRTGLPLGLLLIDLDYFKQYNDIYGHQQGDLCLIEVAETLNQITQRSGDTAARTGGEEFAIIVPGNNEADLLAYGEKIRQAILSLEISHHGSEIHDLMTCSIGGASWKIRLTDTQELFIQTADQALYRAKNKGKNQVCI